MFSHHVLCTEDVPRLFLSAVDIYLQKAFACFSSAVETYFQKFRAPTRPQRFALGEERRILMGS